ncbi:MAG: bifunctional methylenetetrahydrofolate dehydrogenase/methenyltetrahydrofolate cyclohydrolase FolD [Peptococcaceae bacterium]|mgnify:FL=1|nr:bifunctional methylenetetrahydrofolate dehydrogenase/methenyltetrahydrofolate cyclohydrolase FolD [Peptococcaceae bacterium]
MLNLIDGKQLAQKRREEVKQAVDDLKTQGITPGLAVILVGEDPASQVYVRNKEKACQEVGFYSEVHRLPEQTSQEELLQLIDRLNNDEKIHGLLVQLPVPEHIDEKAVIHAISPKKDVDGFLPENLGSLLIGEPAFEPCTPKGCIDLIKETGIDIAGKKAVVVGRSNIVGKPVAMMLLREHATVTICHSKTKNLKEELLAADIVVAAIGKANFITGDMIKDGAVVIDVGINRLENGKMAGDVDRASLEGRDCWLTPVPGGVGPMTITMLMKNTLESATR